MAALALLDAGQRRALLLVDSRGMSYAEVAHETGASRAVVTEAIATGRRQILQRVNALSQERLRLRAVEIARRA